MLIHHIAVTGEWHAAQSTWSYTMSTYGRTLADVGFVHCATGPQVHDVLAALYGQVTAPLMLLTIDTDRLTARWRFDEVPGSPLPYPHIYGPLDTDAVVGSRPLVRTERGWSVDR